MANTHQDLHQEAIEHVDKFIDHFNGLLDTEKHRLAMYAASDDQDSVFSWVQSAAKKMGVTVSAAGTLGIAWFLIKELKK